MDYTSISEELLRKGVNALAKKFDCDEKCEICIFKELGGNIKECKPSEVKTYIEDSLRPKIISMCEHIVIHSGDGHVKDFKLLVELSKVGWVRGLVYETLDMYV